MLGSKFWFSIILSDREKEKLIYSRKTFKTIVEFNLLNFFSDIFRVISKFFFYYRHFELLALFLTKVFFYLFLF